MAHKLPSKGELLAKIQEYNAYIEESGASEAKADEMVGELDAMVPHANITDLMFWGEKERSNDQIVEEALLREIMWQKEGDLPLLLHIRSQLECGLSDPAANPVHKNYSTQTLAAVNADIERLQRATRH